MKPLKLILSGWGPYRDTQSVDFSPIQTGGLFLVAGPTGAGKTTIFDGITFALYGEVSGSVREKDSLRSDFAGAETPTRVELTFLHRGKTYRILRNPRYDRAKLRGEGMTTENEAGELYEGDDLLATGSQQVTEAVTELLGLDYRQFKQISMIAQGEFQQLLTASSKERTLIFRDIFQTKLYDTISQLLSQRVKELKGRLEERKHRMEEVTGGLRMDGEQWDALLKQKSRNYGKMIACVREDLSEKQLQKEKLVLLQTELEKEYKTLVQKTEQVRQNNRMIDRYTDAVRHLETLKQELKEEKEQGRLLKQEAAHLPVMEQEAVQEQETLRLLEEQEQRVNGWLREQGNLKQLQTRYLKLDAHAKQKKLEYEIQEDLSKKAAAGILAQSLEEGVPCPVCGSLTHPEPARMTGEVPGEQRLKELKQEAETWLVRAGEAQAKAAASLGALGQMEQSLGKWKEKLQEDPSLVMAQIENQRKESGERVRRQKQKIDGLKTAIQDHQVAQERCKAAYQQAKDTLHKPSSLDRQDISEWNQKIQELEGKRRKLTQERERIQTTWSVNRTGLKQLEEHLAARQELEEVYGTLGKVERAATGSNNRKLVLEQYVLSVYFEDILQAANLRLRAMTGDRYELYRLEGNRDRRMKESMELEVLDQYTGKRRSVRTLSGGESFKAALALALGTSDVVQGYAGGIQVETLFVDEGFGSLDSESLGQAVDILSALSGGQRLIGIISHVEELKERIDSQVLVEKNNNGSSIQTNFGLYSR